MISVKYMIMTFGEQAVWDQMGIGGEQGADGWSKEQLEDHFRSMASFIDDLQESGEYVAGYGLTGPVHASTVELRDGRPVVSDGPYAESKEVLAGFLLVEAESHDRALEISGRFAGLLQARVELRPVDEESGVDI